MNPKAYALGATASAARRLEIQDAQFAGISERLLDVLNVQPSDRVVELGVGAGSFTRRVLRRLGAGGSLVGLDYTQDLLDRASRNLAGLSPASLRLDLADIRDAADWVSGASVVVARTVLHHLSFPEVLLGRLRSALRPEARMGFIEPEFRAPIARLMALEMNGRAELAPLRRWAEGISRYYQSCDLAPTVGASLAQTLDSAGYRQVRSEWFECPTDATAIENMLLYYDEVRGKYEAANIMTSAEIDRDQRLIAALPVGDLPPVWGMYCVSCQA